MGMDDEVAGGHSNTDSNGGSAAEPPAEELLGAIEAAAPFSLDAHLDPTRAYDGQPHTYAGEAVAAGSVPVATPTEPRGVDAVAEARREGWMPFGTLVDVQLPAGRVVQFSDELDEAGLPLWERIRSAGAQLDARRTFG